MPALARLGALCARSRNAPAVSRTRWALALCVALAADAAQIVLWPMFAEGIGSVFDDVLDGLVAFVLWALLGFRGRLALALAIELVPGLDLFPTWSAVVLAIPVRKAESSEPPPSFPFPRRVSIRAPKAREPQRAIELVSSQAPR